MSLCLKKILISDEIDERCSKLLIKNGVEVVQKTKLTKEQLISEISTYDGLIVRSSTKVTKDVIEAGRRLQIIGRAGSGVDNIDCDEATLHGIIVMNTPGGNTLSATEHTCAMICSLSRDIPEAVASLKAGRWDRKRFMGNELYGKTLAIIGLGRIGRDVASRMQSFGMTTIGYDPLVSATESQEFGVEWLPLEEIWPRCNYITVHTPLIPQTKNMINDAVFSVAPRGVKVVNVARGGIIDEEALLRALKSGLCSGAALDVFTTEPPTNTDLIGHPKVICTPHLGANTYEAQTRVAVEIAQQFVDAAQGKSLFGAINARAAADALDPACGPIVSLASALGKLCAGILGSVDELTSVDITACGEGLGNAQTYLGAAVTAGLLQSTTKETLNLVNAPALAKSRQLKVTTTTTATDHRSSPYVRVHVATPAGATVSLAGLTGPVGPLLLEIGEARFESPLTMKGHVVLVRAKDTSKFLTSMTGAISNGNNNCLLGVSISSAVGGEVWGVLGTVAHISDTKALQALSNYTLQLSF